MKDRPIARFAWPMLAFWVMLILAPNADAQPEPLPDLSVLGLKPKIAAAPVVTAVHNEFPPPKQADSEMDAILQAGCSSCNSGLLGGPAHFPLALPGEQPSCNGAGCYPGRCPCDCHCDSNGYFRQMVCELYRCICCPDPCYEPCFVPLANAAFFTDQARPVTQIRLRTDFGWDLDFPDRAEWFWARSNDKGPRGPANRGERRLDYRTGTFYTEAAIERFSAFVEVGYLNFSPELFPGASGFGDMNVGVKSLLLDCELIQLTFQFRTFIPTGNFNKGLGTGHTSLEPSMLMALKLTPEMYLQSQLSYWIPVGGTAGHQGSVLHYHLSLNHLLWACGHDIQLIGTLELNGYNFCGGAYTAEDGTIQTARDVGDVLTAGPGVRLSICNKIDFGVGSAFAITEDNLPQTLIRGEFRWRF